MGEQDFAQQTAWHMAAMILVALLFVFVMSRLGFRFVIAAGGS